jgi:hypothetical protein
MVNINFLGSSVSSIYKIVSKDYISTDFEHALEFSQFILSNKEEVKLAKKIINEDAKTKKLFTSLVHTKVIFLKFLNENKKTDLKDFSQKDFVKLFGPNNNIEENLKHFQGIVGSDRLSDGDIAVIRNKLLRFDIKKNWLKEILIGKKSKKMNTSKNTNKKNNFLNLYKQDPTMLVIALTKDKNLKLEKKPSIDNLKQSILITI